jgi:hypothetical protein
MTRKETIPVGPRVFLVKLPPKRPEITSRRPVNQPYFAYKIYGLGAHHPGDDKTEYIEISMWYPDQAYMTGG